MFWNNGCALLGARDKENLWSVRSDGAEIATLLVNPLYWITIVGREFPELNIQLADLTRHPDVSIVFSYPYGDNEDATRYDGYIVEGVSTTNLITVRAPHRLSEPTHQMALAHIKEHRLLPGINSLPEQKSLFDTTGELRVAIRPKEGLAYYHFELSPNPQNGVSNAEVLNQVAHNIYTIVTNPQKLLETLNRKVESNDYVLFVYDEEKNGFVVVTDKHISVRFDEIDASPRVQPDRLDVEIKPMTPSQGAADHLQFMVQQSVNKTLSCVCNKASCTAHRINNSVEAHSTYLLRIHLAAVVCYSASQSN